MKTKVDAIVTQGFRVAHDVDEHGFAVDVVRQPLLSGHHRLQHELHAEVGPRKVRHPGANIIKNFLRPQFTEFCYCNKLECLSLAVLPV